MDLDRLESARVAVTGAWGNLGTKLLQDLAASGCAHLIAIDARLPGAGSVEMIRRAAAERGLPEPRIDVVQGDLTNWEDVRWRDALAKADRVAHFAAQNPFPEADWDDASASIDMNLHVAEGAVAAGLRRLVFASSNHVMGRYREADLGAGELRPDLMPGVGTVWEAGDRTMDSTVYAVAKLAGERVCRSVAARGGPSCVSVRIGWCQPGANRPETLNAAGTPTQSSVASGDGDIEATARWFRSMWLSNADFCQLFERALLAPSDSWPAPSIIVNGTSANKGAPWSLDEARQWLGYEPVDDVMSSSSSG